ncbi:helix-turn-helix domain-containing protein [Nocardia sp. NBC_01388]|uniref:helix-turn-helix domain-containing protein n=1 Tax=Nocardia sp. NBC_01388 TaxID=2903596 RepID=UPI00324EFEC9
MNNGKLSGPRLRELRRDAGLTGRKLADSAGWHESKTSKIEYGKQTPSEADLRAWCTLTDSLDEFPDPRQIHPLLRHPQ